MNLDNKLFVKFLEANGYGGKAQWGTKLTPEQRAAARRGWREFVIVRQLLGTCIQCNRKHQPHMQRCGLHRNINKAKCLKWAHEHRDEIRAEYRRRVQAEVCVNSPGHGSVFAGHIKCKACFFRAKRAK